MRSKRCGGLQIAAMQKPINAPALGLSALAFSRLLECYLPLAGLRSIGSN